jgi:hypothetical protein
MIVCRAARRIFLACGAALSDDRTPAIWGIVKMRTVLAAWLGLALISPASAGTFMAGIGATPCTVLLANAREGDGWAKDGYSLGVMAWNQGFISGANLILREKTKRYYNIDTISRDEQWSYLLDFCRRNPQKDVGRGVLEMMMKRLRTTQD